MTAWCISLECPMCHAKLDGHSNPFMEDTRPSEGDLTVCAYCATSLSFGSDLQLRVLSLEEFAALSPLEREQLGTATALIMARRRLRST